MTRPPLPYSPDVEQPSAGEQKTIDGIIKGMPAQDAYGPARQRYFDEVMTFRPAHSLAAHRPLGSVMRARLQIYKALSEFRHHENGIPEQDPATIDAIPA